MNVVMMPTDALRRYNNNAKEHTPEQIDRIAASIEQFGFRQPVVVDAELTIIIGHGRVQAAKQLRLKEVPCVIVNDLSDDEINALRLVDNKLNESGWDFSALEDELSQISTIDMGDFGFTPITDEEIAQTFNQTETTPEIAPEPPRTGFDERQRVYQGNAPERPEMPQNRPESDYEPDIDYNPYSGIERPQNRLEHAPAHFARPADDGTTGFEIEHTHSVPQPGNFKYTCPRCKHRFN